MKKLLAGFTLALGALAAHAATLTPIQLLNPSGSTSGQVIRSTGPSTAPAWGNITAANLATQAANTVLANVTASTASPTAFTMPSCSTSTSALQYTSGTGFTCYASSATTTGTLAQFAATTSAQLAGVLSDETGSGAAVFGTSPTISSPTISGGTISNTPISGSTGSFTTLTATGLVTPSTTSGIKGTAAADSANAGSVGEVITATVASGSAISLTTGVGANVTSISLTAGDWDVFGTVDYASGTGATISYISGCANTTSASLNQANYFLTSAPANAVVSLSGAAIPGIRVNVAATTTVYLVAQASFSGGTLGAYGTIIARRRR